MKLSKILKDTICLELQSRTKEAVVKELVDVMVRAGQVSDRDAAVTAVMDREMKMTTGMQNGIAIPHGKTDTVDCLVAAIGIAREGIDFDAADGQPSRIFVMTLSPLNRTGPHIQFLAEISRLLGSPEKREQILNTGSVRDLMAILSD